MGICDIYCQLKIGGEGHDFWPWKKCDEMGLQTWFGKDLKSASFVLFCKWLPVFRGVFVDVKKRVGNMRHMHTTPSVNKYGLEMLSPF